MSKALEVLVIDLGYKTIESQSFYSLIFDKSDNGLRKNIVFHLLKGLAFYWSAFNCQEIAKSGPMGI